VDPTQLALLGAAFFVAAVLYSSVGHGGASAYLAIMALFSLVPDVMRPTALTLNIVVAGLGAWRFIRAGRFDWRVFWPIALGAAPFAFLGGAIRLPVEVYRVVLGAVLLLAAARLVWSAPSDDAKPVKPPTPIFGAVTGAGIGLLAGLTGTGGGIFLSPLMIFLRWSAAQNTTGISATFIVLNSMAGLAGNWSAMGSLPPYLPLLVGAVLAGGALGVWLGVNRYSTAMLRRALALVMVVAGLKLLLT
jgi:hypothetical protein